jgi:hypothetical protein
MWAFARGNGDGDSGGGMCVGGGKKQRVMGQCLATGGCQTLRLLLINVFQIINKCIN